MRDNPHWEKRVSRDPNESHAIATLPPWTWTAATVVLIAVLLVVQEWIPAAIVAVLAALGLVLVRRQRARPE
jgi:energy-coupling factor transporter transmembrane protein EcfT